MLASAGASATGLCGTRSSPLENACVGLDAVIRVMLGDPADGLHTVCVEEDAEILVVASHRHAAPAATRRSVPSHTRASSAVCPVVIVPPGAREHVARTERGGSIVCGFDGSSGSERALGVAVGLAERVGLEPLAIFVDPARSRTTRPSPVRVLAGDPVHALRERATRPDTRLLAVGSRGRGAPQGGLLGSVTKALAAAAPIPVLVVPPTARVGELLAALPLEAQRNDRRSYRRSRAWRRGAHSRTRDGRLERGYPGFDVGAPRHPLVAGAPRTPLPAQQRSDPDGVGGDACSRLIDGVISAPG